MTCEGHNDTFQNFLREQHTNKFSFNILLDVITLLETLEPMLAFIFETEQMAVIGLMEQTLDLITELMQGSCLLNQVLLTPCQ